MTFSPAVQVLSQQPPVLEAPDLSFPAILRHFPGLEAARGVCVTGSIVAGWGNVYSDVDLYAFSDAELDLPVDDSMELWPGSDKSGLRWLSWMGRYGDTRVDLTVWPTNALAIALKPLLDGANPEFYASSDSLQDFVYRLSIGRPLHGEDFVHGLQQQIRETSYNRALARFSKVRAENVLTDVAGQLESGDVATARLSAMQASVFVVDACLLLSGELCRGQKWLLRRLQAKPECGISADEYRSTVLDGPRAGESDEEYALRVGRWAQSQLVRLEDEFLL